MAETTLSFIFSHSHHQLSVPGCPAVLDVLSLDGHEYLSKPFHWTIEFTSPVADIPAQKILMQNASLVLHARKAQQFGPALQ